MASRSLPSAAKKQAFYRQSGVVAAYDAQRFGGPSGAWVNEREIGQVLALLPPGSRVNQELLRLVGGTREPGLLPLTLVLEKDREYRLVHVGSYSSAHEHNIYAIWEKVPG